jgi:hypothetical protein
MNEIRKHPSFAKRFMTWVFSFAFLAVLSFAAWFYFDSGDKNAAYDIFVYLFAAFVSIALIGAFIQLYTVKCCICGGKTKTIKNVKQDMWQAHCKSCDITWDLGVGTNTD